MAARAMLYVLGGLLVLGGIVMLFFETGMSDWVPGGIAVAGLVILIGLLVVGMSDRAPTEVRDEPVRERVVERPRVVERERRRN